MIGCFSVKLQDVGQSKNIFTHLVCGDALPICQQAPQSHDVWVAAVHYGVRPKVMVLLNPAGVRRECQLSSIQG